MRISHPNRYFGAIDIGGTKIAVGIVRDDGSIVAQRSFPTLNNNGWKEGVKAIGIALGECQTESGVDLSAIGVGCTGPVDPIHGLVGNVALLPGWEGCNLVEELSTLTRLRVALENDADAAALAEWAWGSGEGAKRFLYVTVSTGIGTGFICDGQLYRGADGAHPEMGHHSMDPAGPLCYCGSRGCWESLASGTAIARQFSELALKTRTPGEVVSAKTVFALALAGDELALETLDRFTRRLGTGLANMMTMLVPDVIALGGGVMNSMVPYLQATQHYVRLACREVPVDTALITIAALKENVGLSGAAAVAAAVSRDREK